MKKPLASFAIAILATTIARSDTYTQNFDSIGSGLPTGWFVSTDASATNIGTPAAAFASAATSWGDASAQFRNLASATAGSAATVAQQAAATDRALGLRQGASFGDPGAAFGFNFSTSGVTVSSISIDLMMLSVQTRATTFSLQYGVGTNPSTFTTLGTYPDPGAFGTTAFTFTTTNFGSDLNNQSSVFFRVVALTASSGSGSRDTIGIDNFNLTSSGPITPLNAVPEPATWMLMGVGLLLGAQRLRRKS
jgi:hypothetical protein